MTTKLHLYNAGNARRIMPVIEYKDRAWLMLQMLQEAGGQPRDVILADGEELTKQTFIKLIEAGYLLVNKDGNIRISAHGGRILRVIADARRAGLPVASKRIVDRKGNYQGEELQRTCVRPGAYDAYDKPSIISGKVVYPRGARA